MTRLIGHAVLVLASCAGLYGTRPALSEVTCGTTITSSEKLEADLTCSEEVAIIIIGPEGRLDLNEKTVACEGDASDGLMLKGDHARAYGGIVERCHDGVVFAGQGGHRVQDVQSATNYRHGFYIRDNSNGNRLIRTWAEANEEDGFWVQGDENRFEKSYAHDNGDDGFHISGEDNRLEDVQAIGNDDDGFFLSENASGNDLSRIVAEANGDDGVNIEGSQNKIREATIRDNQDRPFACTKRCQ